MKIEFQTANTLAAHAVCVAAGTRDGLRTAQFYVRDMSKADRGNGRRNVAFLSSLVARGARLADRLMTWSANLAIALFLPSWRKLPSPFAPGMMSEVGEAIRKNSLVHNPLFNAYFFRAAIHIIGRYTEPPYLLLEHRVDAARRLLASEEIGPVAEAETNFLARTLLALVETAPVARVGKSMGSARLFEDAEPNIAVFATACVALLFAGEGKPMAIQDEDEFFAIVGALILPRLKDISAFIANRDVAGLSAELANIKAMY
jgi:malonyl CoA-acyl carrier protein transacylase